jgi:hypothetical protein
MDTEPAEPSRADLTRLRQVMRRWRTVAIVLGAMVMLLFGWAANREPAAPEAATAGAAAAVQAAADPAKAQYESEQAKSEIKLLNAALDAAEDVNAAQRHHSEVMWRFVAGEINGKEAWWQGGDSTCSGWLAANEYEIAVGKLKGREVKPQPIPKQALEFCKQARERK